MPIDSINQLQIDVFGPCNLRCPTCLIGSGTAQERKISKGLMSEEKFAAILDKAKAEFPALKLVGMHNWTEPLLHPRLPELVKIAKDRRFSVYASSNLNVLRREEDLLAAGIDHLAVSLSSSVQERYGVYHAGGDIEVVKANMRRLARAKQRTGSAVRLTCIFHRYRDNARDEAVMRRFATKLGYRFFPTWAYFTPVEKILASQSPDRRYKTVKFNAADEAVAERLAVPIGERLALARDCEETACLALATQLPIDANGNVQLCCGSGFLDDTRIGSFMDMSAEQIQTKRETHSLCHDCGKCGIPTYYHGIGNRELNVAGRRGRVAYALQARQPGTE